MEIEHMVKAFGGPSRMARELKVSRMTIYNWRKQGKMPELPQMLAEMLLEKKQGETNETT
jgi:hypothetical protein